jgi:hypothetical protein
MQSRQPYRLPNVESMFYYFFLTHLMNSMLVQILPPVLLLS